MAMTKPNSTQVVFGPTGIGATPTTVQAALDIFNQKPSGQFFADAGSRINRLTDRVFIGEAIISDGKQTNTVNSWLETMRPNSIRAAQAAVTSTIGQSALVGGSRTSESGGSGSQGCIGISGYSNNNNTTQIQSSYAGYFESRRQVGAGITQGIEVDIVNLGTTVGAYPNLLAPGGLSNALWVASGAGVTGAVTASIAVAIVNNGADFEKGIVFQANALSTASGEGVAVAMGSGHGLVWYDTGVNKVARIRCDATAQSLGLIFANNTVVLQTIAGASLFAFGVDSSLTMATGLKLAMPTLNFSGFTTTPTASAGTASALPAAPITYLQVQINGTAVKIPAYGV